jgi:hypothetical protein
MKDAQIDQILRGGPPDEPIRARPLELPPVLTEVVALNARPARLRASTRGGLVALVSTLVILGGVMGLAGLALRAGAPGNGAAGVGAGPSSSPTAVGGTGSPVPSPASGSAGHGGVLVQLRDLSLRAPAGWHAVMLDATGPDGATLVAFANFDLAGACGSGAAAAPCVATVHLGPGEMLATVAVYPGPMDITAVEPPTGWSARIDGMPAALQIVEEPVGTQVTGVTAQPGCDAHRAWWIGRPGAPGWIDIEACAAGPDRSEFRARVDELAASVVFAPGLSPIPPATPAN